MKTKNKATSIGGCIGDTAVHKLRKFKWPDNKWDTYDKVIHRFELLIQPQNNQINKYVLKFSNYKQTTESFTDFSTELKRRFKLAKHSVTKLCDEHKNCALCQQKYWEMDWRSYIYIGVRDQRGRELIDQLVEDQHTLDRYVEIRESYEAS